MKARPGTVKKFMTALMAAWEAAVDPANAAAALDTLGKFDKGATAELQQDQLAATRPLVKPSPDGPS
jgi:NitT/TauT family transport system substrate-binding protein